MLKGALTTVLEATQPVVKVIVKSIGAFDPGAVKADLPEATT
jgi:hypothetical protein